MNNNRQNSPRIQWQYWRNFLGNFLFGIILVFGISLLISLTQEQTDLAIVLFPRIYILPQYLSLAIAGALGGILDSISLDGGLEMPYWKDGGKKLKTGSVGEVIVGIGGAFTVQIFIPEILKRSDGSELILFVFGLIGGYGGKRILNAALGKIKGRISEADLVAEEKERLVYKVEQLNEGQSLIKLVTVQIDKGLSPENIYDLSSRIKRSPKDLQEQIFGMVKEVRRLGWRNQSGKIKIARTLPIFEALTNSNSDNCFYHAQLGYAYKDCEPPRLDKAITEIDTAIALRGEQIVGTTWKYELNRALIRIMQGAEAWRESILADLLLIDRSYGLAKILLESEDAVVDIPLKKWLQDNKEWIGSQRDGKQLLSKILRVVETPSSTKPPPGVEIKRKPDIRRFRKGTEHLKEQSGIGSVSAPTPSRRRKKLPPSKTEGLKPAPLDTSITATKKTYLKAEITNNASTLQDFERVLVPVSQTYKILRYDPRKTQGHYLVELDYGAGIWYVWAKDWDLPWEQKLLNSNGQQVLSREQSNSFFGRQLTNEQFEDLNRCLDYFEINTLPRVHHFLSQIAHESGGLKWLKEIWGPTAAQRTYEPPHRKARELGNKNKGDGYKFRGTGALQLTGCDNYQLLADYVDDPEVMNQGCDYVSRKYTFMSAGVWWKENNMNALCDRNPTVLTVTRRVNGGTNGLRDRQKYYRKATQIIKTIGFSSSSAS